MLCANLLLVARPASLRRCAAAGPAPALLARPRRVTPQPLRLAVRASAQPAAVPLSSADPSKWITGVTPNNPAVRLAAVAAALALVSQGTAMGFMSAHTAAFLHLLAWGVGVGSNVYTTFVVGILMFKSLPRQTFRDVQEVLFPAFFTVGATCLALQLVIVQTALTAAPGQLALLAGCLGATLLNLVWLEPAVTVVMKERASLEKMNTPVALTLYPEGKEAAMRRMGASFGKLHGLSSAANLAALCGIIAYAWRFL